jgi:glycosyltransferase involved in cell wall biosynthesis
MVKNRFGIGGLALITIGNYTGEKGHRELLEVFRKLPVSKATLISAGTLKPHDGYFDAFEHQAWAINQSRKHIGKRVVMLDGADRPTVRDALKAADLFVFLSNIEASPLVMFEAAAAGVPFLATAAGNNAEIAEWTGGGVIVKTHERPNGRVEADTKDTLWQLTKLAHSPSRRRELGARGRAAWQKSYTWEKLTGQYLELYASVIKARKKSGGGTT